MFPLLGLLDFRSSLEPTKRLPKCWEQRKPQRPLSCTVQRKRQPKKLEWDQEGWDTRAPEWYHKGAISTGLKAQLAPRRKDFECYWQSYEIGSQGSEQPPGSEQSHNEPDEARIHRTSMVRQHQRWKTNSWKCIQLLGHKGRQEKAKTGML